MFLAYCTAISATASVVAIYFIAGTNGVGFRVLGAAAVLVALRLCWVAVVGGVYVRAARPVVTLGVCRCWNDGGRALDETGTALG